MVSRYEQIAVLADDEPQLIYLDVACAEAHLRVPETQNTFQIQPTSTSPNLTRLLEYLKPGMTGYAVEQAAIWILTDDADYEDLSSLRLVTDENPGGGILDPHDSGGKRIIEETTAIYALQLLKLAGIDTGDRRIWRDWERLAQTFDDSAKAWLYQQVTAVATQIAFVAEGTILAQDGGTNSLAWSPTGQQIATGACSDSPSGQACNGTEIRIWDAATGARQSELAGEGAIIASLAWSPDGAFIAAGGCDTLELTAEWPGYSCPAATIAVWDVVARRLARTLEGISNWPPLFLALSPNGQLIAAPSCAGSGPECASFELLVWQVSTGELIHRLGGYGAAIGDAAFSPDSTRLATTAGSEIWIWDLGTGQLSRSLGSLTGQAFRLAWSSRGVLAADNCREQAGTACRLAEVWLWDTATDDPAEVLATGLFRIADLDWSPGGDTLAIVGCSNQACLSSSEFFGGSVQLWEAATKTAVAYPSRRVIAQAAFSPAGDRLALLALDGAVIVSALARP
jgi:WD40 repeat protein